MDLEYNLDTVSIEPDEECKFKREILYDIVIGEGSESQELSFSCSTYDLIYYANYDSRVYFSDDRESLYNRNYTIGKLSFDNILHYEQRKYMRLEFERFSIEGNLDDNYPTYKDQCILSFETILRLYDCHSLAREHDKFIVFIDGELTI